MQKMLLRSVATISREELISFLTEIEHFLEIYTPNLCRESLAAERINDLKKTLQKGYSKFRIYFPTRHHNFAFFVRNCINKRCATIKKPELESTCIHIKQWPEIKRDLADKTPLELCLIASKLVDEAYKHLSDILNDLIYSEIATLVIDKNETAIRKKKIIAK